MQRGVCWCVCVVQRRTASFPCAGWIFKSDPRGRTFKRRWIVVDASTQTALYYANNPRITMARYHVTEQPKGTFDLKGASVAEVAEAPTGAPAPFCFQLFMGKKEPIFACKKAESRAKWMEVLRAAASGEGAGRGGDLSVAAAVKVEEVPPAPWEGWMFKADPEGRKWTKRYGYLDAAAFTFAYFTDNTRVTAKGCIDLRGAALELGPGAEVARMMGPAASRETPALNITTGGTKRRTYAIRVADIPTLQDLFNKACAVARAAAASAQPGTAAAAGGVAAGNPLRSAAVTASTVKGARGWLHKANPAGKYWKRRWADLVVAPPDSTHGVCLKYHTDAPSAGGVLKGAIPLAGATVELVDRSTCPQVKNAPTVFALVVRTAERNWWLAAENGPDRNSWYVALAAACAAAGK